MSLPRSGPAPEQLVLATEQFQRLPVIERLWIVPAKDCGRFLRFLGNAKREIAFNEPFERLGRVARRLILVDDVAESVTRREPLARTLVEAADLHLLAGEMVVDEVELEPPVGGIACIRIAADELAERVQSLLRRRLIPVHVRYLLIIAHRNQILRVCRFGTAW